MGRDMVSIKGTRNGLVILLDPNREFEEIRKTLLNKMESAKGFFKGAKFSFLQDQRDIPIDQKNELVNICKQFGLVPNVENTAPARICSTERCRRLALAEPKSVPGEAALMVNRSLRSGQRISYPGHIIVLGDVNPGAEVVSDGNVLVVGSCRGIVHAGAGGDRSAKVIARRLTPSVLSIADRRCDPDQISEPPTECQVALISGQEIVFEKYQTGRYQ